MAVEYCLITCLGQGVTVTMTIASPCVLTITANGMRNGHPVRFLSNGDTLPTGFVVGTTYYVRYVSANTFHLYDTKAHAEDTGSTTGRINTSGSQAGTHKLVGEYWDTMPTSNPGGGGNYKDRYYYSSVYRCYGSMRDWEESNETGRVATKVLVAEIQGAWDDTNIAYTAGHAHYGYFGITITTVINGTRDPLSFHYGRPGYGYRRLSADGDAVIRSENLNFIIDGFEIINTVASIIAVELPYASIARNCIISATGTGGKGITCGSYAYIYNNIIHNCKGYGIDVSEWNNGTVIYNNLIFKNGVGLRAANNDRFYVFNNISVFNTTNYSTAPNNSYMSNNASNTGTPWTSSGGTNITGVTTADFVAYADTPISTSDYRSSGDSSSHTSSSKFVDAGVGPYDLTFNYDISGNARPFYKNGSATSWDIGPFEFDWGYGDAPQTITVANLVTGSIVKIYRVDTGEVLDADTESGGSVSLVAGYSGAVKIEARCASSAPYYRPWVTQITIPGTTSVTALQELDQ